MDNGCIVVRQYTSLDVLCKYFHIGYILLCINVFNFNYSTFLDDPTDGKEVMRRHYNALIKETEKKKPNPAVVNSYLNKEFSARRSWLQGVSAGERVEKLLDVYPCFKDHVEVCTYTVWGIYAAKSIQYSH